MTPRFALKLTLFIVPAIGAVVFLMVWLDPERRIIRRADTLFATVQRGTLSREDPQHKAERFGVLTAPSFEISGPDPVPTGTMTRAEAVALLWEFHETTLSCTVSRGEASVAFPAKDVARLKCEIEVGVNAGAGRRADRFDCQLEFRRIDGAWLVTRIVLTPP